MKNIDGDGAAFKRRHREYMDHAQKAASEDQAVLPSQTENARREREQKRYDQLIDNFPGIAYQCKLDKQWTMLFISNGIASMSGYPASDFIGNAVRAYESVIHRDDTDDVASSIHLSVAEGRPWDIEYRIKHKDGGILWVQEKGLPVQGEDGCVEYLAGFILDITARKQAEEAHKLSQTTYLEIFNSVNDSIYIHDIDTGAILDVNQTMLEKFGYTLEEAGALTVGDISSGEPPYTQENAEKFLAKAASGEPQLFEWHCKHKNGTLFWAEVSLRRGKIAGKDSILAIERDITKRKQVEEALRLTQFAMDRARDSVLLVDDQGALIYVNDAACSSLGYSREELLRMTLFELDPDFAAENWEEHKEQLRRVGSMRFESRHRGRDGRILPVEVTANFMEHQGRFLSISFARDISERKRAEEEKEKIQVQLNQAQKMESVGRLAGGVAHDFNNMLGVILGHSEILLAQINADQPLHAGLTEIQKAAMRSADLTRQLLAFARKQTVAPKVIDLNKAMKEMLKMLHRLIGEDIEISWIPGEHVWPVKIDPSQIDQILANLCVNARDAIRGVGKITIETGKTVFDDEYCADHVGFKPGEYTLLAVSDNGCGMDAGTLGHLYEPFFTTKEIGKGTGLGLAMVYGVVKQNNGFINVYSEPGRGTTFKIYLPRYLTSEDRLPEKAFEKSAARGHETILIVEDEPALLELTTTILKMEGYTVVGAGTPGEAIRLANEHAGTIHLLISDVVMPEMHGRDMAKNILSLYPFAKCLFMSGYTANVIAHHGILDEGVNFLQKPFSGKELARKVRDILELD
jgi:PAS domain S-box-containing protein